MKLPLSQSHKGEQMKIYIAGPMTGRPHFNIPLFDYAANTLRGAGFDAVSPAELDDEETRQAALCSPDGRMDKGTLNGETWGDFLARDVKLVADQIDAVALLPGWKDSRGAQLEVFVARLCRLPIFLFNFNLLDDEDCLLIELDEEHEQQPTQLPDGEERVTSETGGQKGRKPARMDLIPPGPLLELSKVYGFGAGKYDDHNYIKGYNWSLSYGAMQRHLMAWASGEDIDPESGRPHLAHAAWHCFSLMLFSQEGLGVDDRIFHAIENVRKSK